MYDMNSGYDGYHMSNRAKEAYESGEMPLSKWTKEIILCEANKLRPGIKENLKKLHADELRFYALSCTSWHHTSKYVNSTDFYSVDEEMIDQLTPERIDEIVSGRIKENDVVENKPKYVIAKWTEWEGSRRHPKPKTVELPGIIKGEVFTDYSGNKRKKIYGNYFSVEKELTYEEYCHEIERLQKEK